MIVGLILIIVVVVIIVNTSRCSYLYLSANQHLWFQQPIMESPVIDCTPSSDYLSVSVQYHHRHHIFVYSVVVTRNSSHRDKNYTSLCVCLCVYLSASIPACDRRTDGRPDRETPDYCI